MRRASMLVGTLLLVGCPPPGQTDAGEEGPLDGGPPDDACHTNDAGAPGDGDGDGDGDEALCAAALAAYEDALALCGAEGPLEPAWLDCSGADGDAVDNSSFYECLAARYNQTEPSRVCVAGADGQPTPEVLPFHEMSLEEGDPPGCLELYNAPPPRPPYCVEGQCPAIAWTLRGGGVGTDDVAAVGADSVGVVIIGTLAGSAAFMGGPATFGTTARPDVCLPVEEQAALFVVRYTTDGSLSWVKATDADVGTEIKPGRVASLSDGGVTVTGVLHGYEAGPTAVVFGAGEANETTVTLEPTAMPSMPSSTLFVARYLPDGALSWVRSTRVGTGGDPFRVAPPSGLGTTSDDGIVVVGTFHQSAVFGAGEAAESTLSAPFRGAFAARYAPDGSLVWVKLLAAMNSAADRPSSAVVRPDGSLVVTGEFSGELTLPVGDGGETAVLTGAQDIFIAGYDMQGTLAWARQAGGPAQDRSASLSTAPDGSLYLSGTVADAATFGPGEPDETVVAGNPLGDQSFLARYSADGRLIWAQGTGPSFSWCPAATSSALMDGTVIEMVSCNYGESYATLYTSDGELIWRSRPVFGGEAQAAVGVPAGGAVVVGRFGTPAVAGQGEAFEQTLESAGASDVFVMRLDP